MRVWSLIIAMTVIGYLVIVLVPRALASGRVAMPALQTGGGGNQPLLIIGEDWAPFEYADTNGKVVGIDAEILERIFTDMGQAYELRLYPWSRAKRMAESGEADAVITVSYKKTRESWLHYTEDQRAFAQGKGPWPDRYLWKSEYVFFCKRLFKDKIEYDTYPQLKKDGYRIGVVRDYAYDKEFTDADLNKVEVPDFNAGWRSLADGKFELYPSDKMVGLTRLKILGLSDQITYIDKPMFAKPYLMPATKNPRHPEAVEIINEFYRRLAQLRKDGVVEQIHDKYLR